MKKRSLCFVSAFAFLMVFLGCTGEESSVDEIPHYTEVIENWQAREASCGPVETERLPTGHFNYDLEHTIDEVVIDYVSEGGNNYWKTSCESISDGGGDCEDMAILAYRTIMDSSLVDYYDIDVRIRVLDEVDSSSNHVVAIVYYTETVEGNEYETVYEINNLIISNETDARIVVEFDDETIF